MPVPDYVAPNELIESAWGNSVVDNIIELHGKFTGWTAYTPALSGAGWALGSTGASATGVYHVTGDVVHFQGTLIFGTVGAAFGAGAPSVSVPVAALTGGTQLPIALEFADASAGFSTTTGAGLLSSSTFACHALSASGAYVAPAVLSSTVPFTWAAGDELRFSGWYRKA